MDRNTEALAPFAFYSKSQGIVPTRQCAMVAVSPTMLNRKVSFKRYHGNTAVALKVPNLFHPCQGQCLITVSGKKKIPPTHCMKTI